jgi:hypothetical protein
MERSNGRMRVTGILVLVVLVAASVLAFRWVRVRRDTPVPAVVATPVVSVPRPDRAPAVPEVPAESPAATPAVMPEPPAKSPAREQRPAISREASATTPTEAREPADVAGRKPAEASPNVASIAVPDTPPIVESIPDAGLHPEPLRVPELPRAVSTTGNFPKEPSFRKETIALRDILHRYEQAYDRLDAQGAAAIWSTVDSRSLERAFSLLRYQELVLDDCSIAVTESDATAQCPGRLRYARRIGDGTPKTEYHVWMIEFARTKETWRIVRVTAQ